MQMKKLQICSQANISHQFQRVTIVDIHNFPRKLYLHYKLYKCAGDGECSAGEINSLRFKYQKGRRKWKSKKYLIKFNLWILIPGDRLAFAGYLSSRVVPNAILTYYLFIQSLSQSRKYIDC